MTTVVPRSAADAAKENLDEEKRRERPEASQPRGRLPWNGSLQGGRRTRSRTRRRWW